MNSNLIRMYYVDIRFGRLTCVRPRFRHYESLKNYLQACIHDSPVNKAWHEIHSN